MAIRITCIRKSAGYHTDPHHAITDLGWVNDKTREHGKSSRQQVHDWLKTQGGRAYVVDKQGNKAYVFPRENAHATQYVQTAADRVWTDNLLALPECQS